MPTLLTGMRITHISLVRDPANREQVIWKSQEGVPSGSDPLSLKLTKLAKSEEKRIVYGLVYCPDMIDAHGEYSNAEEIAKAAYGFMRDLRGANVDVQHDFNPKNAFVAESWLTKGNDPLFPDAPEGSWAVGIRVEDDTLWESVKKGELKGLSMAGFAQRVKKAEEGAGILKNIEEFFAGLAKMLSRVGDDNKTGGNKEGNVATEDSGNIEKQREMYEALLKLPETLADMSNRIEKIEQSTPGLKAGNVDNSTKSSSDGLEGIL